MAVIAEKTTIRPFTVEFPQSDLEDLQAWKRPPAIPRTSVRRSSR